MVARAAELRLAHHYDIQQAKLNPRPLRWLSPMSSCRFLLIATLLVVSLDIASSAAVASKKASFGVRSKVVSAWPQSPAAAQSLEWLRDLGMNEAVAFLKELVSGSNPMEAAEARLHGVSVRTFHELLVQNSYYSPRIEMLRTLEREHRRRFGGACAEGSAWALAWTTRSGTPSAACKASSLKALLANGASGGDERLEGSFKSSQLDVVLQHGRDEGPVIVLYGALLPSSLEVLGQMMQEVRDAGEAWRIVFRYADAPPSERSKDDDHDLLTGWGLELAIKSSEYKTHADENGENKEQEEASPEEDQESEEGELEQTSSETELDGPVELDGLSFHVLLKRKPALRKRLWAFKEQLEVERDTDVVLKAWEIKDIGLQATTRIKSSSTPLLALMRLSQNFPAHVVGLSRTSVPSSLRNSMGRLRSTVRENAEVFSLNGRLVRPDHSDLSLFPMLKSMLPYFLGIERLVQIGMPEASACELLKDSSRFRPPDRLEWRSPFLPPVTYHVKKDKKTQKWGSSLQHLMYAMHGGLAPVRLPLFNIVFVFDPAEISDLMSAANLLAQGSLPMSLHYVPLASNPQGSTGKWDEQVLGTPPDWLIQDSKAALDLRNDSDSISNLIANAYIALLQKSPKRARDFIKALGQAAMESYRDGEKTKQRWPSDEAGVANVQSAWTSVRKSGDDGDVPWETILSGSGNFTSLVENCTQYATQMGVPVPSMLINGKLLLKGAYEGQNIFQAIGMEQQNLMRGVMTGELQEEDGLEDFFASQGLLSAYHQDITPEVGQRGGEEGMPGKGEVEVKYVQFPKNPFMALKFLTSIEPEPKVVEDGEEGVPDGKLSFFHVVVLSRLSHVYLLHTFASHMLSPDRELLEKNKKAIVPHFLSHWTILMDTGSSQGEDAGAMRELAACVRGLLEAGDETINRQKLALLKFLGLAIPAAMSDGSLSAAHTQELCLLGVKKKIDPDFQDVVKASIEKMRAGKVEVEQEQQLLATVASGRKDDKTAVWVCNGRLVALEADGQAVSPRHVQALELLEAQYDISQAEGEAEDDGMGGMGGMMGMMGMGMFGGPPQKGPPPPRVVPLYERMQNISGAVLPVQTHGLVAAIRSEAFASSFGRSERFDQPREIFETAPPAFRLQIPPAHPDAASPITVYGIVDPLSTTAQSASAVLALFGMTFNAEVNLVLNPIGRHSEYPLKRYYREVIRWPDRLADGRRSAELDDGAGDVGSGIAELKGLATKHTLTAAVHALPTWLVTAHKAESDMDNLRLADVGNGEWCDTTYMLRQLYVEGQAFILGEDGWPVASAKGLQVDVVDMGGEALADTIVMGNLGYFQVRGNPGLYGVRLKAGLSNDTFEIANAQDVEVSSYITPPYQIRVRLRAGRSADDLTEKGKTSLGWDGGNSGKKDSALSRIVGGIRSLWGTSSEEKDAGTEVAAAGTSGEELPTIHIFSVASGHLYEKLLGIMISSVRAKTKCPLHFWFIDTFLSPKFKAFLPVFARQQKFTFDFISYKWPSWLNPQSEKQRLIWAYKILFLDVMFPLDVPKVIFIDADQVVRADVRELWDTDLKGKVYGFVPMGDTNAATEGFRFWKQGYWKNHLGDMPYHISALFVVDLVEFRRTSTGDQLRGIYNQLSRDPGSLSNLDQDLPNFAQHQVPIHSLPAEWLWCETWCSQESKPAAKTIDLCQNPLTKEPKIVMAQRIISEWKTYHDEVQRIQDDLTASSAIGIESSAPANKTKKKDDEL